MNVYIFSYLYTGRDIISLYNVYCSYMMIMILLIVNHRDINRNDDDWINCFIIYVSKNSLLSIKKMKGMFWSCCNCWLLSIFCDCSIICFEFWRRVRWMQLWLTWYWYDKYACMYDWYFGFFFLKLLQLNRFYVLNNIETILFYWKLTCNI